RGAAVARRPCRRHRRGSPPPAGSEPRSGPALHGHRTSSFGARAKSWVRRFEHLASDVAYPVSPPIETRAPLAPAIVPPHDIFASRPPGSARVPALVRLGLGPRLDDLESSRSQSAPHGGQPPSGRKADDVGRRPLLRARRFKGRAVSAHVNPGQG